jgi:gliding motility-associated-like protein
MIFLRTIFLVLLMTFFLNAINSQTVLFSEDFEPVAGPEYNGATTGTSAEGYTWNTSCPDCIPTGDFFETRVGQMRGNDTNGPAFFTANGIDATGCLLVTFQFDYNSIGYSGSGNLECADECAFSGPPGCSGDPADAISNSDCNNCWDFLAWEINTGSVSDDNVVLGLDCNAAASGSAESDPLCVNQPGADPSNVNIVITMSMWATNEWMEIDNITILCYTEQEANDNGIPIPAVCANCMVNIDDVMTVDLTCSDSDDGEIVIDATGSGLSGDLEYSINNGSDFQPSGTFTGLMPGTYDIVVQDDADSGCFATTSVTINAPPPLTINPPSPLIVCYSLFPPSGEILNLDDILDEITNFDPSVTVNWFFDMAGNNPLDPTDPGDLFTLINNSQTTVYATITDGSCESNIVPVSIDLNEYPDPNDAMLTECPASNGMATFTPSDADGQITGGDPDWTVTYHNNPTDAASGDSPIIGDVTTASDLTLYASVQSSAGCISVAELELIVDSGATPEDASLEACDDGSGQGTFDLTDAEGSILNGQPGTVIFYEDLGLNTEIFTPTNYTSNAGSVYAVIDDGSGCISAPSEVTLNLITIDPNDLFLSFSPSSACGNATIEVTINTPANPFGDYTFEVSYGPVSAGPVNDITITGMDGDNNFDIDISESHIFVLNSVTGPGPAFCEVIFSPGEEYIIDIEDAPDAFPASITACGNTFGEGTFDLSSLEDIINDFSGNPVEFYEDLALNNQINNPGSYVSGPAIIYAVVDGGGGCFSDPVEVTLLIDEMPDPVDISLDITNSCDPENVTLTFSLPNGDAYDFDLLITDGGGTTVSTNNGVTNLDQLTFSVTETTTFSINEITSSFGCTFTLAPGPSETITIGTAATANTASLQACDDGSGQATFDLTLADDTVNGNSGETVLWFTDQAGNNPITPSNSYTSGNDIVYAAIDDGNCVSETAEVTLTVLDQPEATINLDSPISCNSATDGEISVTVTGPMPYTFDWNNNTYDGQQVLTNLSPGFYALTFTDGNGCEAFADIDLVAPAVLDLTCMVVNDETSAGANDGEASFDISGGSPLYDAVLTGPTNASLIDLSPNSYTFSNLIPGDYTITITDDNGCVTDCMFTIQATTCVLNFSLMPTDASCNGADDGSISVVINDGVPNYQYDWSDDQYDGLDQLNSLAPGMYTLTITDMDGCTFEQTATIAEPALLTLDCRANATGEGSGPGSYTFTYDGGTPFYLLDLAGPVNISFTENDPGFWDTAVLPPGAYTFTLTDDNGCSQSCSFVIDPTCDLSLNLTGNDPLCAGAANGTLNLEITGTQTITAIDWNDNNLDGLTTANNLLAGTYNVTVVDQLGCVEMASITLTDPEAYAINCAATNLPSGPAATDGALTITINDGPGGPYTVAYDDGAGNAGTITENAMPPNSFTQNNLPPGIYQITVTNPDGCTTTCSVDLQVPPCSITLSQNGTPPTCSDSADGSVTVTPDNGIPSYTFNWSDDTFDGMDTATGLTAGTSLSVTVTDGAGCIGTLSFIVPGPPAIVLDCSATTNPSNAGATDGSINLATSGGMAPYTITWTGPTNGSGNLATAGNFLIDNLGAGTYTITVEDAAGCTTSCMAILSAATCDLALDLQGTNPDCASSATGSLDLFIDSSFPIVSIDWNVDAFDGTEDHTSVAAGLYEVTVTDAAGCVETTSLTLVDPPAVFLNCSQITQPTTPLSTDGGVDVILSGGSPAYTVSWDGPVMGMATVNTPGTFSITDLSVGSYIITVEDSNGCQETCSFTLTDSNTCNFSIVLSGTDPSCNGVMDGAIGIQLINGTPDYTFAWSDSSLDSQGPTGDQTGLGAGMYSVTVTDAAGCEAIATTTLADGQANPTMTSGAGAIICADSCYALPLSFVGNAPFDLSYQINFGGNTTSLQQTFNQTEDSLIICPANESIPAGDFEVVLTLLEDATCQSTLTDTTTFSYLTPAIGNLTTTICLEDSVTIGTEVFDVNNPSGQVILASAASSGCDSTVVVNLTFFPASTLLIEDNICLGDTVTYGGEEFFVGNSSGVVVLDNASSNGCDSTITVNLTELATGINNINDDLCAGDTLIIAGEIFDENRLVDILELPDQAANGCDSLIVVTLNLVPLVPNPLNAVLCLGDSLMVGDSILRDPGLYDILIPNGASSGCDSLVQVDLDFHPPAESLLEGTFCAGEEIMVGDSLFNAANASGMVVLPAASTNGCDSTVVVDLTFLPSSLNDLDTLLCFGESLTIGNQTFDALNNSGIVILENEAANGCDSTILVTATFRPELLASLGADTVICSNQALPASFTLVGNDQFDVSLSVSTGFNLMLDDLNEGTYDINVGMGNGNDIVIDLDAVTSASGCPVTIEDDQRLIRSSNLDIDVAITNSSGGTGISCAGQQDGILTVDIVSGIGPFSYAWNTMATSSSINNLPAGIYSVTVTDLPGCTQVADIEITAPTPIETSLFGASAGCFGSNTGSITIDTVFGGSPPYEYSLDNEFFSGLGAFPTLLPDLMAGSYTVYIQDANDCQIMVNAGVPEGQLLQLELGGDETIQLGDSILIDPIIDFTPTSWQWTPTDGLSQPDTFITYAAPTETTIYQLELWDANGCTVSDIKRIFVEQDINVYIPSAFSPNGDGSNDILMIFADQTVAEIEIFQIFDRWGNQVYIQGPFQPNDPLYGWDGKLNGEEMNAAVFVYFAEVRLITGEVIVLKGDVVLLR